MAPGLPHACGPPGGGAFLPRHLRRGRLHRPAGAGSVPSETRVSPRGEGLTPFGSGSRRALSRVPENWALLRHQDSCSDFLPVVQNVSGVTMTPSRVLVMMSGTRNCPLGYFSPTAGL